MRFIVVFLLGIVVAMAFYYGGGMQWLNDRWYGYGYVPPPPVIVEAPVPVPAPAPVSMYPNAASPVPEPGITPGPYANGDYPSEFSEPTNDDDTPEPTYTPPGEVPPVGVAPVGNGPPISLQISMGHRGYGAGCEPAYTVFNDTTRPIILTERAHYRWNGRGPKDVFVIQPGERQVACAADVYQARDSEPHFDYYRQNVHYGPDAIDLPPPVNIRVKE